MAEIGKIEVEAILDDNKFHEGMKNMIKDLDKSQDKSNELNVEFQRGTSIIGEFAVGAAGLGATILGFLTAGITQSSTWKANWAGVSAEITNTSEVLGREFKPEIKLVTDAMKNGLRAIRDNAGGAHNILKDLVGVWSDFVGGGLGAKAGENLRNILSDFTEGIEDAIDTIKLANEGMFTEAGTLEEAPYPERGTLPVAGGVVPKQATGESQFLKSNPLRKPSEIKLPQSIPISWGLHIIPK